MAVTAAALGHFRSPPSVRSSWIAPPGRESWSEPRFASVACRPSIFSPGVRQLQKRRPPLLRLASTSHPHSPLVETLGSGQRRGGRATWLLAAERSGDTSCQVCTSVSRLQCHLASRTQGPREGAGASVSACASARRLKSGVLWGRLFHGGATAVPLCSGGPRGVASASTLVSVPPPQDENKKEDENREAPENRGEDENSKGSRNRWPPSKAFKRRWVNPNGPKAKGHLPRGEGVQAGESDKVSTGVSLPQLRGGRSEAAAAKEPHTPRPSAKALKHRWVNPHKSNRRLNGGEAAQAGERGKGSAAEEAVSEESHPPGPPATDFKHRWERITGRLMGDIGAQAGEGDGGPASGLLPGHEEDRKEGASRKARDVSAICQALEGVRQSAVAGDGHVRVAALAEALQPWASKMRKHVLTAVLKQLKDKAPIPAAAPAPSLALPLLRWAQGQPWYGEGPSEHAYNLVVGACCRAGDLAQAHALLEEMRQQGCRVVPGTYRYLLDACGRAGKWQEMGGIRRRMEAEGLVVDVDTCRTLIRIYAGAGRYKKAIGEYKAFVAAGGKPDVQLYTRLIWLHGKSGNAKGAQEVLREMKDTGCPPDPVSYNTLMDALGRAGQPQAALGLLEEMRERGLVPNASTYGALVGTCTRNGMCEEAVRLFEEMRLKGFAPDVATWSCLVRMWAGAGRPDEAWEWFNKMAAEGGSRPDDVACNLLLHGLLASGKLPEARRVLEELTSRHEGELATYRVLLGAHAECTDEEGRDKIWGLMENSQLPMGAFLKRLLQAKGAPHDDPGADRDFRAELDAALGSMHTETLESKRRFVDALVDTLLRGGQKERALELWALAGRKGQLRVASSNARTLVVDLRSMPLNTALVAVEHELASLRQQALEKGEQPFVTGVELITGHGEQRKLRGKPSVKQTIEQKVAAMGLLCAEVPPNASRLKVQGEHLREWLVRPEAGVMLNPRAPEALKGCEPPLPGG